MTNRRGAPRFLIVVAAVALESVVVPCAGAPPTSHFQSVGVTPAGRIWTSDGKYLVLRSVEGQEQARHALLADERHVLSAADDGQRVTSPWPSGLKASFDYRRKGHRCRLLFRDSAGLILRISEPEGLESNPAFFGADALYVRSQKADDLVYRANAAEVETVIARVPRRRIVEEAGKVDEVNIHASSAGLLVEFRGPYRAVYLGTDGELLLPDPAIDCGEWQATRTVFPGGSGTLARVRRFRLRDTPFSHLERIGKDGRLISSVEIAAKGESFPLPGDRLLFLGPAEAVLFDDRGKELERAPLTADSSLSAAAATRLAKSARRFEGQEKNRATGSDWVELALASPTPPLEQLSVAAGDPDGALHRLAAIPDGHADVDAGRRALDMLLRALPRFSRMNGDGSGEPAEPGRLADARAELLEKIDAMAPRASGWLLRAAAPWALNVQRAAVGSWALESYVDALARREPIATAIPQELMTRELAERIALLDRARLDDADRTRPAGSTTLPLLATPELTGPSGASVGFHIPPGSFPEPLFDCLIEAGPTRFLAAVSALRRPGQEAARMARTPAPETEWHGLDQEMEADREPGPASDKERLDAAGRVGSLLADAARSADGGLRAASQLLAPYYGRSLDTTFFRRDVLSRPELTEAAAAALLADRLLPADAWKKLLAELLAGARRRSAKPLACIELLDPSKVDVDAEEEPEALDSYCALLMLVASGGEDPSSIGDLPSPARAVELAELTRSASAPPELRLYGKLARVFSGLGVPADALEIWGETELPIDVRLIYLNALFHDQGPNSAGEAIVPELTRVLREGGLSPSNESAVAAAVGRLRPAEMGRLAAERLLAGKLSLRDLESANAWLSHVPPEALGVEPRLRVELEKLLDHEYAGPAAARVLAKAGVPAALKPLVFALKTGCFG